MKSIVLPLFILTLIACSKNSSEPDPAHANEACQTAPLVNDHSRISLIQSFDQDIVQGIASKDVPNSAGAMGRNKQGYFHVRFQMGISSQADYAVYNENIQALEYAIKSIEYAFDHQLDDGNFELSVPSDLSHMTPNEADLASGVSFFLSSLGLALNNFAESSWYHSAALTAYKDRVEALRPQIDAAAQWLLNQSSTLELADQNAPNRLLFNALAFYGLGNWLEDENLKNRGISFANLGKSKQQTEGFFLEGGGWDSSYQGVALNVGFNLYSLLPNDSSLKAELWDGLSCGSHWQKSRILATGEISTEGNVRVFPGGESFLGQEKQVDWIKTMVAMYAMGYYGNDASYLLKANRVKAYYN